jgi:hypothetical protein
MSLQKVQRCCSYPRGLASEFVLAVAQGWHCYSLHSKVLNKHEGQSLFFCIKTSCQGFFDKFFQNPKFRKVLVDLQLATNFEKVLCKLVTANKRRVLRPKTAKIRVLVQRI